MRVVVTGASGNVGTALLRQLRDDPGVEQIVAICRRVPADSETDGRVRWVGLDVASDDLAPALDGADAVVHLAWLIQPSRRPAELARVNIEGSRRVFVAAARAGASALVLASSIGAYSPAPKDRRVDESWPTGGIASSQYSREKAKVERILDDVEAASPELRVVRLRPGLIFQRAAASEIVRFFLGALIPAELAPRRMPLLPLPSSLVLQAVHADDVASAYAAALTRDVRGAFNVAAEPVLDPPTLAEVFGARLLPLPAAVLQHGAAASWRLRLQPTTRGWVDLALQVPVMDTRRARDELGWQPVWSSAEALQDLLEGMRSRAGGPTPALRPLESWPRRVAGAVRSLRPPGIA